MTLKVTQGHPNCRYLIGQISLPISGLYNDDSILHRFRDTTTFTE